MRGVDGVPADLGLWGKDGLGLWLQHARPGWTTDEQGAEFPNEDIQGIRFCAAKRDGTLRLSVQDVAMRVCYFAVPIRAAEDRRGLRLLFEWEAGRVRLSINGEPVATEKVIPQP